MKYNSRATKILLGVLVLLLAWEVFASRRVLSSLAKEGGTSKTMRDYLAHVIRYKDHRGGLTSVLQYADAKDRSRGFLGNLLVKLKYLHKEEGVFYADDDSLLYLKVVKLGLPNQSFIFNREIGSAIVGQGRRGLLWEITDPQGKKHTLMGTYPYYGLENYHEKALFQIEEIIDESSLLLHEPYRNQEFFS